MKQWWRRQHQASHEAVIMSIAAVVALCTLFIYLGEDSDTQAGSRLFQPADVCRVSGNHGDYSILFNYAIPLIGDSSMRPLGRLKNSEAAPISSSIFECVCLRSLGRAQLDQEQQRAYGFDQAIVVDIPGQATWHLASGKDGQGYALDEDGTLYQLDRDLAGQLDRDPQALRAISLDLPRPLLRIQYGDEWTLGHFREHWWLDQGDTAQLADQRISADFVSVFQELQAISFATIHGESDAPALYFEGMHNGRKQAIALRERGASETSSDFRIVERQQQFEDFTLKEAYLMKVDAALFTYPRRAFVSKQLIPVDRSKIEHIQLGKLQLQRKQGRWWVDESMSANQDSVAALLGKLGQLPAANQNPDKHIGSVLSGTLRFMIPASSEAVRLLRQAPRHAFIDRRLMPGISIKDVSGLVIHSSSDAPQLYQKQNDGSWDLDPAVSDEIQDFITALCSARVSSWQSAYNPDENWTSTLTLAVGDQRLVLKKSDRHLIGIESRDVQGYLDADSARDVFGDQ